MNDICQNFHKGNRESFAAHAKIESSSEAMRWEIWKRIKDSTGMICEEIERELGLKHQTASARISELKRDGLISPKIVSGVKQRRPTSSGCLAMVYTAIDIEASKEGPV